MTTQPFDLQQIHRLSPKPLLDFHAKVIGGRIVYANIHRVHTDWGDSDILYVQEWSVVKNDFVPLDEAALNRYPDIFSDGRVKGFKHAKPLLEDMSKFNGNVPTLRLHFIAREKDTTGDFLPYYLDLRLQQA